MGIANLHKLFAPESIAVIGASESQGSIGTALISNLLEGGFKGRLLPVTPKYTRIRGLEAVDSISKATGIDLAIIAVPIKQVPKILEECTEAGIKAAIIISAGGKETGVQGLLLEEEIRSSVLRGLSLIPTSATVNSPSWLEINGMDRESVQCYCIFSLRLQKNRVSSLFGAWFCRKIPVCSA